MRSVQLDDFAVKTKNLTPAQFPEEKFDLLSIPAYDIGSPEVALGSEIGSSKQLVCPGDVLISKIVPHIRRVWVVPENGGRRQIASGEWIVFRSREVLSSWLRQILLSDSFHRQFMNTVAGVGGSLLRARPAHVYKIRIDLPELDAQRHIAHVLDKADALRAKRRETIAHLDALSQSIFYEMFGDQFDWIDCKKREVSQSSPHLILNSEIDDYKGKKYIITESFKLIKLIFLHKYGVYING